MTELHKARLAVIKALKGYNLNDPKQVKEMSLLNLAVKKLESKEDRNG